MGNGLVGSGEGFDRKPVAEGAELVEMAPFVGLGAPVVSGPSHEKRLPTWYLDRSVGGRTIERFHVRSLPLQIGRSCEYDLVIPALSVSKHHAELYLEGEVVKVRDLNSTNGTFVNRKRISVSEIREGDILHIAEFEFRLGRDRGDAEEESDGPPSGETVSLGQVCLQENFPDGARELFDLLDRSLVCPVFQPIVTLPEARVVAFEVLGRGLHPALPRSPLDLFRIAESVGRADELSRVFRRKAIEIVQQHGSRPPLLLLNTHPSEIGTTELVESLQEVRRMAPELALALEIHEDSAADSKVLGELKTVLEGLDIGLAYDDFGLGERFLQITEVPPDYLKFDISVVKKIIAGAACERRLLANLIDAAREMKSSCIAEGIETLEEAEACRSVGFGLGQGFVYYKPMPLSSW